MQREDVPGPRGRWLVGQVSEYEENKLEWLLNNRARYGDIVRLAPNAVVVFDAAVALDVLRQTNDVFYLDDGALGGTRAKAAQLAGLPDWMRRRRLATRSTAKFTTTTPAERLAEIIKAELQHHEGQTKDLFAASTEVCGNAIVRYCIGGTAGSAEITEVTSACMAAFQSTLEGLQSRAPRVRWLPRRTAKQAASANKTLNDLIADQVARRRAEPPREVPRDLLDQVLLSTDNDTDAIAALRLIIFTGVGPPGAAMTWTLMRLAENAELAESIAREAPILDLAKAARSQSTPSVIKFFKEVLRMHPPQWILSRTVTRAAEVGPYTLQAGQEILICSYLIHRDERWWSDPDEFIPDRWSTPNPPPAYIPFGRGPRTCPGATLAENLLLTATSVLAQKYTVRLCADGPANPNFGGLLLPAARQGAWSKK
ncbi:cytochrome P450 [Actinoallomurus acanthiterrae]